MAISSSNVNKRKLKNLIGELKKLVYDYLVEYVKFFPRENLPESISKLKQKLKPYSLLTSEDWLANYEDGSYLFRIGNVEISSPLISAPIAGISDNTYRIFTRFFGSALTFTEMVTSYGIYYNNKKSLELTSITELERPCALQLFGSEPAVLTEAAKRVEDKADIIDINMGCPAPKVLKAKSGGYLLQDENKIKSIVSGLSSAVKKPVTIKVRTGWDKNNINILNIAKIAESSGASAITIHGRTVKQRFSGEVDYDVIRKVKKEASIPVIVSGDIDSPQKALEVLEFTGCDGVMVGRASMGSIWLLLNILLSFKNKDDILEGADDSLRKLNFTPGARWRKEFAILYLEFLVYFKGEYRAVREFRKYFSWIFKGTRRVSEARKHFFKIETFDDAVNIIEMVAEEI